MWFRSTEREASTLKTAATAVVLSLLGSPTPIAMAQGASPLAPLAGSWSGSGVIETSNGNERIRCRAAYEVGGMNLQLNLRCASDNYNFNLATSWRYEGGQVSGTWSESSRHVSGSVTGQAKGNQILVTAQGIGFAANLLVVTSGSNQTISIRGSGSEIKGVQIALRRITGLGRATFFAARTTERVVERDATTSIGSMDETYGTLRPRRRHRGRRLLGAQKPV